MDVVCTLSSIQFIFFLFRRNTVVVDFITWLRKYNEKLEQNKKKVGFFGIDIYSLQASREEVLKYLEKNDPGLFIIKQKIFMFDFISNRSCCRSS
jgi:erythromycin esterase-like protein